MGTLAASPESTPLAAASLASDYPQFKSAAIPAGSGAVSAWAGYIQPFQDDESARGYLRVAEADGQVQISEGTIFVLPHDLPKHWAEPLLVNMAKQCKILILEMPTPAHPRAYLLEPFYSSAFLSFHPHPRGDLAIKWGRYYADGLCVYSAAEHRLSQSSTKLVDFLDLVTTHVARHLIWLRTRRLFERRDGGLHLVHQPMPGELIIDNEVAFHPRKDAVRFWAGYWPGKEAKATNPTAHIRRIQDSHECWCGTGKQYVQCCKALDLALSRSVLPATRKRAFGAVTQNTQVSVNQEQSDLDDQ